MFNLLCVFTFSLCFSMHCSILSLYITYLLTWIKTWLQIEYFNVENGQVFFFRQKATGFFLDNRNQLGFFPRFWKSYIYALFELRFICRKQKKKGNFRVRTGFFINVEFFWQIKKTCITMQFRCWWDIKFSFFVIFLCKRSDGLGENTCTTLPIVIGV